MPDYDQSRGDQANEVEIVLAMHHVPLKKIPRHATRNLNLTFSWIS